MRQKKTAMAMAIVLCTGLTACGSKTDKTMWEALDRAAKQDYNQVNLALTVTTDKNLIDEFDLDTSMFGVEEVSGLKVSFDCKTDKDMSSSCVISGSLNQKDEAATLAEVRYVDQTYYVDTTSLSDLLSQSDNYYMKMVGAMLPTDQWISFTMDDVNNAMQSEGYISGAEGFTNDAAELKDAKKLTQEITDIFLPLLEEACGKDEFVTQDGNKFTLAIDSKAATKIAKNVVSMEKNGKSLSKAVDSLGVSLKNYGSDSMSEAYDMIKDDLVDGLQELAELDIPDTEIQKDGSISFSIENKKDSAVMGAQIDVDEVKMGYDVTLTKGELKKIEVPEKTITIQEYMKQINGL